MASPLWYTLPPKPLVAETYRLALEGLTGEHITLSLKDLDLLPQKSLNRRWVSHTGWSVRCQWQGVLLQHLIEKLRPSHGQNLYVHQTNAHGFTETITLKDMLLHRPMLVRGVNGQPLSLAQGGPVALMVFHCFGHKGLPQLTRLALTDKPSYTWSEHLGVSPTGDFTPGQYFAWDLGTMQPIRRSTEVEDY
jgi:DMSO/TMAO reductase YedYZ molybdopterin-dependent catalytic subunit